GRPGAHRGTTFSGQMSPVSPTRTTDPGLATPPASCSSPFTSISSPRLRSRGNGCRKSTAISSKPGVLRPEVEDVRGVLGGQAHVGRRAAPHEGLTAELVVGLVGRVLG